jgi:hypothetical protein
MRFLYAGVAACLLLVAGCTPANPVPTPDIQATVDAAVQQALADRPTPTSDIQPTIEAAVSAAVTTKPTAVPTWTPEPTWTPSPTHTPQGAPTPENQSTRNSLAQPLAERPTPTPTGLCNGQRGIRFPSESEAAAAGGAGCYPAGSGYGWYLNPGSAPTATPTLAPPPRLEAPYSWGDAISVTALFTQDPDIALPLVYFLSSEMEPELAAGMRQMVQTAISRGLSVEALAKLLLTAECVYRESSLSNC